MESPEFQNIFEMFLKSKQKTPSKDALLFKLSDHYHSISYQELYLKIQGIAQGLIKLGFDNKIKGALLCANRPEWVISDLALISLGNVTVPIYPTLSADEIKGILNDCQAKIIFLESSEHYQKVMEIESECPHLEKIITMANVPSNAPEKVMSFLDLLHLGQAQDEQVHIQWQEKQKAVQQQDIATIVYTSGSTGSFKGVVLSHLNLISNVIGFLTFELIRSSDLAMSILPLSHIFERTVGYYSVLKAGGTIAYAESTAKVAQNLREVEPTVMIAVPRFFEKVQKSLLNNLTGFKRQLFNWALQRGYKYHKALREKRMSPWRRFNYRVAKFLVLDKLHQKMGLRRLRHFGCGGAPFARHILLFFEALGLRIVEGYGLTECSPIIAINNKDDYRPGTVGRALPGIKIKLAPDGELLAKGTSVMQGYYCMPERTAKVLQDGYLHTGDIASIDNEGYVKIIDRKKEILVLSNGKNVAPVGIEKKIGKSPYILQCIVIGNGQSYITALIVPNMIQMRQKFPGDNDREILDNPEAKDFIEGEISKHSSDLAPFSQVKKFRFLKKELSFEGGELTPTMKIKRKAIARKYKTIIDEMYAEVNEHIVAKKQLEDGQAKFI
ncbi:MAG: AMP-binding protein [Chlamydiales bacterium]|nr:AMP-binding protein [Chlamydiales bacterium]